MRSDNDISNKIFSDFCLHYDADKNVTQKK